ncbi:MAG: endonuclease/exonuclease/phosphatase family protein, partial [Qipengyuania sp.]
MATLKPDIALLQEVSSAAKIFGDFHLAFELVTRKDGAPQRFGNLILSRYPLKEGLDLRSEIPWVNREREFFRGNILERTVDAELGPINVINFYSPAWPCAQGRLVGNNLAGVKLENNPDLWCTEILWKLLIDEQEIGSRPLMIGGDFNSSETFDHWGDKPRGNLEIIERMNALGLFDALRHYQGKLIPTFRNPKGG